MYKALILVVLAMAVLIWALAYSPPGNVTTIQKNVFAPIERCDCTTKWIKI
jgi:hypothetical protein